MLGAPTDDSDLDFLDRDALLTEVRKLRAGIREHRDSTRHELCWHHPALWNLLPERVPPELEVPAWPQFMRGCVQYRQSLDAQLPDAPRVAIELPASLPRPDMPAWSVRAGRRGFRL
jgi:hypothetical protein